MLVHTDPFFNLVRDLDTAPVLMGHNGSQRHTVAVHCDPRRTHDRHRNRVHVFGRLSKPEESLLHGTQQISGIYLHTGA
jgi:hypothetical protein